MGDSLGNLGSGMVMTFPSAGFCKCSIPIVAYVLFKNSSEGLGNSLL